jgi:hypothetical protein
LARFGHDGVNEPEGWDVGKQVMWIAVGVLALVVLGMVVLKVAAALIKFLVTALVVLALVGGALYMLGRARNALRGGRSREIR